MKSNTKLIIYFFLGAIGFLIFLLYFGVLCPMTCYSDSYIFEEKHLRNLLNVTEIDYDNIDVIATILPERGLFCTSYQRKIKTDAGFEKLRQTKFNKYVLKYNEECGDCLVRLSDGCYGGRNRVYKISNRSLFCKIRSGSQYDCRNATFLSVAK